MAQYYSPGDDEVGDSSEEQEFTSEDEWYSDDDGRPTKQPCKYYNKGSCQKGQRCEYLHICQYHFQGNCKYGAKCKYKHGQAAAPASSESDYDEDQCSGPQDNYYHWQVREGMGWLNIKHDWVIEAQFSQPAVKGMDIYNTKFGVLSIDFNRMKIRGKDLKVRRWRGKDDHWVWYSRLDGHWCAYGEKNSKGNCLDSIVIERQYQRNERGSYQFTVNGTPYKIDFKEMMQTNLVSGTQREVQCRPKFVGVKPESASLPLQNLQISGKPDWQFLGDSGQWHSFSQQGPVTSGQLESEFQKAPQGSIKYTIGKQNYQLDFSAMSQTNLATCKTRQVRRTVV